MVLVTTARMAVFIEPAGDLLDMVVAWKARIARRWPAAAYVDHPPHATLWVGELRNGRDGPHAVADAVSQITEFPIAIRGPHVFCDDAPAGGGQTCAFAASLTEPLTHLQHAVAEALRRHRAPVSDDRLCESLRQPPFLQSWREYGFPFVGAHWTPHFTVASLRVRRDDPVLSEFLSTTARGEMPVRQLSWWHIAAGHHVRLATMQLASRVT